MFICYHYGSAANGRSFLMVKYRIEHRVNLFWQNNVFPNELRVRTKDLSADFFHVIDNYFHNTQFYITACFAEVKRFVSTQSYLIQRIDHNTTISGIRFIERMILNVKKNQNKIIVLQFILSKYRFWFSVSRIETSPLNKMLWLCSLAMALKDL